MREIQSGTLGIRCAGLAAELSYCGLSRKIWKSFSSPLSPHHYHDRAQATRASARPMVWRTPYFKPYTSSSPRGFVTVTRSWPVEIYTLPLATIGELNLIPYPGTSAEFTPLLYNSLDRFDGS
jgi:hypothetical protein